MKWCRWSTTDYTGREEIGVSPSSVDKSDKEEHGNSREMLNRFVWKTLFVAGLSLLSLTSLAEAYIGPGAGFALVSSFFILIIAALLAFFTILSWPVRAVIIFLKRRKIKAKIKVRRVIIVGFDGLDPGLCNLYMAQGKLPNLSKLREQGSFYPLQTTTPAISPVAWSTFTTGVNPGKHRIFDFFTRDPKTYLPVLSSALISVSEKIWSLGPFRLPVQKTVVTLLRKSTAFWKILGEKKIFSTILRVPITFPPEKFYGACLSAMCTPDLRGTLGSFTYYTTEKSTDHIDPVEGALVNLKMNGKTFETKISGPSLRKNKTEFVLTISVKGEIDKTRNTVTLDIGNETVTLKQGDYSPWIKLVFKAGFWKKISGVARFLVIETAPNLKLYMTPINIDPEQPALPISHPFYYSVCLSKIHGPFATLGLAEDTWALNQGVIDEGAFLQQSYDIYEERKTLFLDNLKKTKEGLLVSVFDTTDRIQHMFFRYLSEDHPANTDKDTVTYKNAIEQLYEKADHLVGRILMEIDERDLLLIVSDHGFKSFKWGVNLNTWLWQEGYLVLKQGKSPGNDWFADVDWLKSRAFAFGLAGIFINTKGREKLGIVNPGEEKNALLDELKTKLEALYDDNHGKKPVRRGILASEALHGPYVTDSPDLFIGYEEGYRTSWNCAIGKITTDVVEDNKRRWSGDHCLDPELVPGVLFSNWRGGDLLPSICDIAPTVLNMFGIEKPAFHDGNVLDLQPPSKTII